MHGDPVVFVTHPHDELVTVYDLFFFIRHFSSENCFFISSNLESTSPLVVHPAKWSILECHWNHKFNILRFWTFSGGIFDKVENYFYFRSQGSVDLHPPWR